MDELVDMHASLVFTKLVPEECWALSTVCCEIQAA